MQEFTTPTFADYFVEIRKQTRKSLLRHEAGKPVVVLRGVSIGGIPIPNAWLGNLKNIDLVQEFGGQRGFWDAFSKSVGNIKVSDGSLYIKLKE